MPNLARPLPHKPPVRGNPRRCHDFATGHCQVVGLQPGLWCHCINARICKRKKSLATLRSYKAADWPGAGLGGHNYCRNIDEPQSGGYSTMPWCILNVEQAAILVMSSSDSAVIAVAAAAAVRAVCS